MQAVDGVDFALDHNRAVVVLGELGCGKSSLAKAILRLLPRNAGTYSGQVYLDGQDIMLLTRKNSGRIFAGLPCPWFRRLP